MNANELSDELQDLYKNYCHANAIKEAATMLRQQQAKIDCLLDNNARLDAEIEELQDKEASQYLNAPLTQEPVAIRYDFDGYGYQYMDSGSGSDWQTRVDGEPLYTNPVKELHLSLQKEKETGELLAVTYTDDEHRIVEVLWQRPPVKELMDEEITEVFRDCTKDGILDANDFAKAILRKAQEK